MFNIGGPELLVILLVALLVLGPNKLPDAARQVGRAMHELRRLSNGFQQELREALESPSDKPATRRAVVTGTKPAPETATAPGNGQGNGSAAPPPATATPATATPEASAPEDAEAADDAGGDPRA